MHKNDFQGAPVVALSCQIAFVEHEACCILNRTVAKAPKMVGEFVLLGTNLRGQTELKRRFSMFEAGREFEKKNQHHQYSKKPKKTKENTVD